MAKFASECMTKMNQLTAELSETLGPDTGNLAMRVGMHSGSVTGGVLRGQKSRFQLFGDTMNTASRMESNGVPNRIHVSQETADELGTKGKAHWVTPREDKIVAKGKDEMQTYWVNIRSSASTADTVSCRVSCDLSDGVPQIFQPDEDNLLAVPETPETLNGYILKG
jgi:class 3 adenylate cyclase